MTIELVSPAGVRTNGCGEQNPVVESDPAL